MRRACSLTLALAGCTPATLPTDEFAIVETESLDAEAIDGDAGDAAAAEPTLVPIDEVLKHETVVAPRTHPLWPTASADRCPAVMFGSLPPELDAGPTFDRITDAHVALGERAQGQRPSAIVPLRHHAQGAGLRLFAATNAESGCMMGWTHTHCVVSDAVVACAERPELATGASLQRVVQAERLRPHDLPPEGWFELAVALSGVETLALSPDDPSACIDLPHVLAVPPSVERTLDRVDIRFTALEGLTAWWYRIEVEANGGVRLRRDALGSRPRREFEID
ncbi:MAG: hypothetical protein K1X88_14535 [Nannocystaceae bacterium]|nr:hypothetical protein [Nannocystaceae bacterium]